MKLKEVLIPDAIFLGVLLACILQDLLPDSKIVAAGIIYLVVKFTPIKAKE